jgi:hypothetical protein
MFKFKAFMAVVMGSNESSDKLLIHTLALFMSTLLWVGLLLMGFIGENVVSLVVLGLLALPMGFRLGRMLFPRTDYMGIVRQQRASKKTSPDV